MVSGVLPDTLVSLHICCEAAVDTTGDIGFSRNTAAPLGGLHRGVSGGFCLVDVPDLLNPSETASPHNPC